MQAELSQINSALAGCHVRKLLGQPDMIRPYKHISSYDLGKLPGSAKQCILGILFLNQPYIVDAKANMHVCNIHRVGGHL